MMEVETESNRLTRLETQYKYIEGEIKDLKKGLSHVKYIGLTILITILVDLVAKFWK